MTTTRLRVRVGRAKHWLEPGDVAVIGRDDHAEIRVPAVGVSRRHARLSHQAKGWVLEDLGSTNGTWLGGERVTSLVVDRALSVELGPGGMPVVVALEPVVDDGRGDGRRSPSERRAGPRRPGALAAPWWCVQHRLAQSGRRVCAWWARR